MHREIEETTVFFQKMSNQVPAKGSQRGWCKTTMRETQMGRDVRVLQCQHGSMIHHTKNTHLGQYIGGQVNRGILFGHHRPIPLHHGLRRVP